MGDRQNREGSKIGGGGVMSSAQDAVNRRDRLRKLALETIDLQKDPYFMRNHLGTYECKLCMTVHPNEGNYLAHTQGKKHQYNLGKRATMEAKAAAPKAMMSRVVKSSIIRIGKPAYSVTKSVDSGTAQKCLRVEIDYPQRQEGIQPRHRFMSSFEQKVEAPDAKFQYLVVAADPYENIAFKIPNKPIDKAEGRFLTQFDQESGKHVIQFYFLD